MRRIASPPRLSARVPSPMRSFALLVCAPGATSNRTSLVTRYVPLCSADSGGGATVCHVPPPVTSSLSPTVKVPDPVSVIVDLFCADADALPPASMTLPLGLKVTMWMMSHRNVLARSSSLVPATTNIGNREMAAPKIHHRLILMTSPQNSFCHMFYESMLTQSCLLDCWLNCEMPR